MYGRNTLKPLLFITSGASKIVIGERSIECDCYWPSVDDNTWKYSGTVSDLLVSEFYSSIKDREVGFISTLESDRGESYIKILI